MMGEVLRVGLVGASGNMGRMAAKWVGAANDMELVAAVDLHDEWGGLSEADVALEVTAAGNGESNGARLLQMGVRPVIGTSGVSRSQASTLDALSRELGLGGVVVPNFSILVTSLQTAAKAARGLMPDVSITEAHQPSKLDAPSGTALQTAAQLRVDPSMVHSVRLPGAVAMHEVRMSSDTETLMIRHESLSRESFREGVLMSLRYAALTEGVAYGLDVVMGEACKVQQSV